MAKTDLLLSNISAIITMIENFPMDIFDKGDGKVYASSFEFMLDILRICGVDDRFILNFLVEKLYGIEGKPGFTINGLYESLRTSEIKSNPNNEFIQALEKSIKILLMGLFTSLFTCSSIPILPNKLFDYDDLTGFMSQETARITKESAANDNEYKLKIPIGMIDLMGMLNISPVSPNGNLYYINGGKNTFYKKVSEQKDTDVVEQANVNVGDGYYTYENKYNNNIPLKLIKDTQSDDKYYFNIQQTIDVDLEIKLYITFVGHNSVSEFTTYIPQGTTRSGDFNLSTSLDSESVIINDVIINSFTGGGEVYINGTRAWLYLSSGNGFDDFILNGGKLSENLIFGSINNDVEKVEKTAIEAGEVDKIVKKNITEYHYKPIKQSDVNGKYIRVKGIPNIINSGSPEYICVYEGENPNLLYRTYDMNAFIWYVLNRGNRVNQTEKNHLMWDNRNLARKNGNERVSAKDWNDWYSSKRLEGNEFKYLDRKGKITEDGKEYDEIIYPIIQIEKFSNGKDLLVRFPSQRYMAPKKRMLINGEVSANGKYFNASMYKFDWDYLQSINILNPKLLLARFIEHLLGLSLDTANAAMHSFSKKEVEIKIRKAVRSIIEADDMQVENCFKSFSNEDFDELLNEIITERYTASKTGDGIRTHDIENYNYLLDQVNEKSSTEGNITQVKRLVNEVSVEGTNDFSSDYEFNFKFDSKMLERLLIAIVMPIVECLFTPQVLLLIAINFEVLGITNFKDAVGNDFGLICNLIINKILEFVKEIVVYIKNYIVKLLIDLFYKEVTPMISMATLMMMLEQITDYLIILEKAIKCIPLFRFDTRKIGYIEDVDYADIKQIGQPESSLEC